MKSWIPPPEPLDAGALLLVIVHGGAVPGLRAYPTGGDAVRRAEVLKYLVAVLSHVRQSRTPLHPQLQNIPVISHFELCPLKFENLPLVFFHRAETPLLHLPYVGRIHVPRHLNEVRPQSPFS